MAFEPGPLLYRLVDGVTPIVEPDLSRWTLWWMGHDRFVAETFLPIGDGKEVRVSTVYLGIDLGRHEGPPLLWETLVFGGIANGRGHRYASLADAIEGHRVMVASLAGSGSPELVD